MLKNIKGLIAIFITLAMIFFLDLANAGETRFASEELNLLTSNESAILTKQALMVAQSSTIKSHPSKEEIQKLSTYFNSGVLLTSFPMSKSLQDTYLSEISDAMSQNQRITYVDSLENKPDGAVLTTISVVPNSEGKSIVEVSVVAFNWEKAASKKAGMEGIIQSIVWYSVARKVVPISVKDIKDIGSDTLIHQTYSALVKSAFDNFLLAL